MELQNYNVQILTASEGKFLTQKTTEKIDDRIYVKSITVNNLTKENYREATENEKIEYENSLKPTI